MNPKRFVPNKRDITKASGKLRSILMENILPFWYPQILDREEGGYRLHHDTQGNYLGPADKGIVSQSRTVWFFSRMVRSGLGDAKLLDAAEHGYRFLRRRLWDKENGGFFWTVNSNGSQATNPCKHMYGQAFALYALSEYSLASEDPYAKSFVQELFQLIEQHAHDAEHGGYVETFNPDWSIPDRDSQNPLDVAAKLKLMNTHLHIMEGLTTYYQLTREPLARERLLELIFIQSNTVVRKSLGGCTDQYERNWIPVRSSGTDRISFGHDIENIWLLMEACRSAAFYNDFLTDLFQTLFDYSLKYGFDQENGGFFESGALGKSANRKEKIWWVQAEALACSLEMTRLTGNKKYWDCFLSTLDWIEKHQMDRKRGDWYWSIREDGSPAREKAGLWKAPYHNGRAMIHCLELIDKGLDPDSIQSE